MNLPISQYGTVSLKSVKARSATRLAILVEKEIEAKRQTSTFQSVQVSCYVASTPHSTKHFALIMFSGIRSSDWDVP